MPYHEIQIECRCHAPVSRIESPLWTFFLSSFLLRNITGISSRIPFSIFLSSSSFATFLNQLLSEIDEWLFLAVEQVKNLCWRRGNRKTTFLSHLDMVFFPSTALQMNPSFLPTIELLPPSFFMFCVNEDQLLRISWWW